MRADIVPGAVFPDYELPDHRGKRRTLRITLPSESLRALVAEPVPRNRLVAESGRT